MQPTPLSLSLSLLRDGINKTDRQAKIAYIPSHGSQPPTHKVCQSRYLYNQDTNKEGALWWDPSPPVTHSLSDQTLG